MSKRRISLAGLLAVAVSGPAWAQISIDLSRFEQWAGTTRAMTAYEALSPAALQGVAQAAGGGQTYDFTAAAFKVGYWATEEFLSSPAGTPGASNPQLAQANMVVKTVMSKTGAPTEADADSASWSYHLLEDDGFAQLGAVMPVDMNEDGTSELWTMGYSPALLTVKLPLTFGATWTQVATAQSPFYNQQTTNTFEVDGWGTLLTPSGSAPCLRLRHVDQRTVPFVGGVTQTTTLSFLTLENLEATIVLDQSGQPVSATYFVFDGDGGQTSIAARTWSQVKDQAR